MANEEKMCAGQSNGDAAIFLVHLNVIRGAKELKSQGEVMEKKKN